MAGDPSTPGIRTALVSGVERILLDVDVRHAARRYCLAALLGLGDVAASTFGQLAGRGCDAEQLGVLRFHAVKLLLAAKRIVAVLDSEAAYTFPTVKLPYDLVLEVASLAADSRNSLARLEELLAAGGRETHPMAVSVLHAAGRDWRPSPGGEAYLAGAYLQGAKWRGVDFARAELSTARLDRADLAGEDLRAAQLLNASLRQADLSGARLREAQLFNADLTAARLAGVVAKSAGFRRANLTGADLSRAGWPSRTSAAQSDRRLSGRRQSLPRDPHQRGAAGRGFHERQSVSRRVVANATPARASFPGPVSGRPIWPGATSSSSSFPKAISAAPISTQLN